MLISLLLSSFLFGQVVNVDKPELENQRRKYEQHLQAKIEKSLNNIVKEDSYIVNVSVKLRRLAAESITFNAENNKPVEEQERLEIQKEFNGEAGVVPLSKIGLWTVAKQEIQENETKTSTYRKRVRNFSELIRQIQVDILVDEERNDEPKLRVVRQVVNQLFDGRLAVRPQINIRAMQLGTVAKKKELLKKELLSEVKTEVDRLKRGIEEKQRTPANTKVPTIIDHVKDFKDVIGTLFLGIVLFLMGLIISQRYAKVQDKRMAMDETISLRQSQVHNKHEEIESSDSQSAMIGEGTGLMKDGPSGFDQFNDIAKEQPEKAAYMVKQWLYSEEKQSMAILNVLPNVTDMHTLALVLNLLSDSDRKQWNRMIRLNDHNYSMPEIEYFLTQRISNHMIEPDIEMDEASKQVIASLTPQEAVICIREDIEVGALLAMTMPSLQFTRVLSLLEPQLIKGIAAASGSMDAKTMQYSAIKVDKIVKEIRAKKAAQTSAFMDKVPELIRDLGVSKEQAIFESVAQMGNIDYLMEVSMNFFPASLIPSLPASILKQALDTMELVDKAELIASQMGNNDYLLEALGGGKLKEILMVEIDEIDLDSNRKSQVLRTKQPKWQKFVNRVRAVIQKDEMIQDELKPLVKSWGQKLATSSGGANAA